MNDQEDLQRHIDQEVQRKMAAKVKQHGEEVTELRSLIHQCQSDLVRQNAMITHLSGNPTMFGTLLAVHNYPTPRAFKTNDEVLVVDDKSPHYLKGGTIISGINGNPVLDEHGYCLVKLFDETEVRLSVGLEGKDVGQVRLSKKSDGSWAVVSIDGKPWEVSGVPDFGLQPGDSVKINPETKAIICKGPNLNAGHICRVAAILENGVEVLNKGERQLVFNPKFISLQEGDRVVCDHTMFSIIERLPAEDSQRYRVSTTLNVTWDDVGGLDQPKAELREALELPFQKPELFSYYNISPLRGILLYGPPGCGKTLLARVAAWAMSNIHQKESVETAYIYVKSPEILDKYIGNTEQQIRELFERARRHYRQHGYKAILAFDEADAIMPQRGTRRSSDIADTIVPMFLGEMDGVDPIQTAENPVVILMTNRPDVLDPAITRPGRISRHIKIERPTLDTAVDIMKIHAKNVPFAAGASQDAILMLAASDLFSKSRLMYKVNGEHDFTLAECVNGAMLEEIISMSKLSALQRDLKDGTRSGLNVEDLRQSINKVFKQQRGLNHSFDLQDFAEKLGIQPQNMKIDRCFGGA